ncbi:MAG: hypothetical protein QOF76_674 [Solirubrobacteraceae bacterium]|jgi:SAM-dependent methyltransferase|nr:hypothetical protein [Solirubrobacteraceae bacterium]
MAVEEGAGIYYQGTYWNDYPGGLAGLQERTSGDPAKSWSRHFKDRVDGRVFDRALMLNCGNGWVERDLFAEGTIRTAVGVDSAQDLLDEAAAAARAAGLDCAYHRLDTNTAAFPEGPYDLVVNFAAAHHVTRVDRVFRAIAERLDDDGWFVAFDYVGPHRNQYPWAVWERVHAINDTLPEDLRADLEYPHLPTMLATDPTEAVHAELLLDTLPRYFAVRELRRIGGALAYPIMTHNRRLAAAAPERRNPWIERIMAADAEYLAAHPESTLFAYWDAQPLRGADAPGPAQLEAWAREEDEREAAAAANGGLYGRPGLLGRMEAERDELRRARDDLRAERDEDARRHQAALAAAAARFPLPQWQRLHDGPVGAAVRRSRPLAAAWARLRRRLER